MVLTCSSMVNNSRCHDQLPTATLIPPIIKREHPFTAESDVDRTPAAPCPRPACAPSFPLLRTLRPHLLHRPQ